MTHPPGHHVRARPPINPDLLAPYGQPGDVEQVRAALTAYTDKCMPCYRVAVGDVARNPHAMVTLRRMICNEMQVDIRPERGSAEEREELDTIDNTPVAIRHDAVEAIITSAVDTAHQRCGDHHH